MSNTRHATGPPEQVLWQKLARLDELEERRREAIRAGEIVRARSLVGDIYHLTREIMVLFPGNGPEAVAWSVRNAAAYREWGILDDQIAAERGKTPAQIIWGEGDPRAL